MTRQRRCKYSTTLLACCFVFVLGVGLAGVGTVGAQENFDVTVDVPRETTVGDRTTLSASVTVPERSRDYETDLTVTFSSNGQQIGSRTVTVADGETVEVTQSYTFEQAGDTEIRVEAKTTFGRRDYRESSTTTLRVVEADDDSPETTSLEGAAFAVPESLEDDIEEYRENAPDELDANAFVLATRDEVYVVFTQQRPTEGVASVDGRILDRDVSTENLSFGVVAATSTSFETTGTEVGVREVADNSDQYRLELVRIDAHYRRVSTLTDPDEGRDVTLSTTSGVLVENPQTATSLFTNVGANARTLNQDTSAGQIDEILNNPRGPHLHTFSFKQRFWTDAEATVDAIVLDPQSAARQFIDEYDQAGVAHAESGEPILYVVEDDFQPQQVDGVTSINSQSGSLDGEVVETEVRLYQEKISVQETAEHYTGCSEDLLQIQTPQGPVCVNVVQDSLLHGGTAWNSVPGSRSDTLLVMGVSSRHQDTPEEFAQGRYRIKGEVVSTSRLDETLPEETVLVIYDMERIGSIDYGAIGQDARSRIETPTGELTARLRQQIGGDVQTDGTTGTIELATTTTDQGQTAGDQDGGSDDQAGSNSDDEQMADTQPDSGADTAAGDPDAGTETETTGGDGSGFTFLSALAALGLLAGRKMRR